MQRLRETSRGLEFTQEMGIVTFAPDSRGDVRIWNKQSSLRDRGDDRLFIVEGRDNLRDFGEWLTRLATEDPNESPTPSSFDTYTVDQRKWVAVVSTLPAERGSGLAEFLSDDDKSIGADTIEDLSALIDSASELIGSPSRNLTRVENEAFTYPFGIPTGMTPVLLATQTHDHLQLQFDALLVKSAVPLEGAQQLGSWSLQGLAEIQKKSVWG